MRIATTAAKLNVMIQQHIDSRPNGGYTWHSAVYLHKADATGCNWNIEVNCNEDADSCGINISRYLDTMRSNYYIASDDATAVPAYETGRTTRRSGESTRR
jgi:hypothetical protein